MSKITIGFRIFIVNLICIIKNLLRYKKKENSNVTTEFRYFRKAVFTSSFIQKWYAKDFSLERWISELQMLKDIGVREIILQSVVDTKNKYAMYPSKIDGYSINENDMILLALDAAKIVDIKVRVGLGENDDWWEKGWCDFKWLNEEAEINKKIVNEIFEKYGYHEAFVGWYISHEFSEFFSTTKSQQANLNWFYKSIANEIKCRNSNLSIMISPFYISNKYKIGCLELWSTIVRYVLEDTGIDIVALQDSVGVGFNTIDNVGMLFHYTKQATDSLGMKLYADTETFSTTDGLNFPATQEQIFTRMSKVSPYVEGFVAFSINHFQNKNTENQIGNYEDYLRYCNENK
ncbi:DUF4434 domain-containing protein [Clostridium sp.]|uniref:DUF4434 domain-containing protein n=1 Tax=Clostridium sp. TaxID=1506 RepID=UPI0028481904|nr:DUF4434 domain-containing protein [Clostridium sp.]MDR3594418.1 DUF4434 domain-containing protein [Clostridium sp.]